MESTKVGQAGGDTDGGPETKGNLSLFENQEETNVVQEGKAEKFSKGIVTLNRLSKSLMNAVKNPRYTIVHDNGPSNIDEFIQRKQIKYLQSQKKDLTSNKLKTGQKAPEDEVQSQVVIQSLCKEDKESRRMFNFTNWREKDTLWNTEQTDEHLLELIEIKKLRKVVMVFTDEDEMLRRNQLYDAPPNKPLKKLGLEYDTYNQMNPEKTCISSSGIYEISSWKEQVNILEFSSIQHMFNEQGIVDEISLPILEPFLSQQDELFYRQATGAIALIKLSLQSLIEKRKKNQFTKYDIRVFEKPLGEKLNSSSINGLDYIFLSKDKTLKHIFDMKNKKYLRGVRQIEQDSFVVDTTSKDLFYKNSTKIIKKSLKIKESLQEKPLTGTKWIRLRNYINRQIEKRKNRTTYTIAQTYQIDEQIADYTLFKAKGFYVYLCHQREKKVAIVDLRQSSIPLVIYNDMICSPQHQISDSYQIVSQNSGIHNLFQPEFLPQVGCMLKDGEIYGFQKYRKSNFEGWYHNVPEEELLHTLIVQEIDFDVSEYKNITKDYDVEKVFFIPGSLMAIYTGSKSSLIVKFAKIVTYYVVEGFKIQVFEFMRLLSISSEEIYQVFMKSKQDDQKTAISLLTIPVSDITLTIKQELSYTKDLGHWVDYWENSILYYNRVLNELVILAGSEILSLDLKTIEMDKSNWPAHWKQVIKKLRYTSLTLNQFIDKIKRNMNLATLSNNRELQLDDKEIGFRVCIENVDDYFMKDFEMSLRLNVFNDTSILPINLLLNKIFTVYFWESKQIFYFKTERDSKKNDFLSFIQLRNYIDDFLDFRISKNIENTSEVIQYINSLEISELFSYNIFTRTTFFYEVVNRKHRNILEEIIKILEALPVKKIPFLFPEVVFEGKLDTAFDRLFSLENPRTMVEKILSIILNIDEDGLLYQHLIERNLQRIISLDVDLKTYYLSKMTIRQIAYSKEFNRFHKNPATLYIPVNYNYMVPISAIDHDYNKWILPRLEKIEPIKEQPNTDLQSKEEQAFKEIEKVVMAKRAGLVKVPIFHAVTWLEAKQIADSEAGGLPTRNQFLASGVSAGDGVDLWMPVRRQDAQEEDYCQIGNHAHNKQRFISHLDTYGYTQWANNTNSASWRPTTYIYAVDKSCGASEASIEAEQMLVLNKWRAGKDVSDENPQSYRQNPWDFNKDGSFKTLRDSHSGNWICRADSKVPGGVILRMEWREIPESEDFHAAAEFALKSPDQLTGPEWTGCGSNMGFMNSWNIKKDGMKYKGTWSEHSNIDMCGQGDSKATIDNWKERFTIEQIKKIVEINNYSSITVSAGTPSFNHAAIKRFNYQLKPEHCKPITTCCNHPCTIYIFNRESQSSSNLEQLFINHPISWEEAKRLSNSDAGGLPTRNQLKYGKAMQDEGMNLWMPVRRQDEKEGDWVNIGQTVDCKRYTSHLDEFGPVMWGSNNMDFSFRPSTYFYVVPKARPLKKLAQEGSTTLLTRSPARDTMIESRKKITGESLSKEISNKMMAVMEDPKEIESDSVYCEQEIDSTMEYLQNTKEIQHEIVYEGVNMPMLLSKNPKQIIELVKEQSDKDITFLQIDSIKLIIQFKWQMYAQAFFMKKFIYQMIFIMAFYLDLIVQNIETSDSGDASLSSQGYLIATIVTRGTGSLFLFLIFRYELMQMNKNGYKEYFEDYWNFIDVLQLVLYGIYIPLSLLYDSSHYLIKIIDCMLLLILLIKMNYYLYMFESIGFVVSMFVNVFKDLIKILIYFSVIMIFFAIMLWLVIDSSQLAGSFQASVWSFMWLIMSFQVALDASDFEGYSDMTDYQALLWVIWLMIVIIGYVVVMNLIIAVVGKTFEDNIDIQEATQLKAKVQLIFEMESIMDESFFLNDQYFPQFILVRRPLNASDSIGQKDNDQIQDMKYSIDQITAKIDKINKINEESKREFKEIKSVLQDIKSKKA